MKLYFKVRPIYQQVNADLYASSVMLFSEQEEKNRDGVSFLKRRVHGGNRICFSEHLSLEQIAEQLPVMVEMVKKNLCEQIMSAEVIYPHGS